MYTKKRRVVVVLVCMVFILVIFFAFLFKVREEKHHCKGADCVVCILVHQAEQTLNNLKLSIMPMLGLVPIVMMSMLMSSGFLRLIRCISLVSQKVRLND